MKRREEAEEEERGSGKGAGNGGSGRMVYVRMYLSVYQTIVCYIVTSCSIDLQCH